MPPDPAQELRDLSAVHEFYLACLQGVLGHAFPVPAPVQPGGTATLDERRQWLEMLDLAITAPMLRDALKTNAAVEKIESLLRYFVRKGSPRESDWEKTDLVVTFLFRKKGGKVTLPALAPGAEGSGVSSDIKPAFQDGVAAILGMSAVPPLAPEHAQLVHEFQFLRQEVEDFRHFDELMDSGIRNRVHDIKHKVGVGFYHPRALATAAEYNVFFGERFEQLFRETAQEMKHFAEKVQQEGGSIMSRVDGDVIVKNLAEIQETALLQQDYRSAADDFNQISKYKKAVNRRSSGVAAGSAASQTPAFAGMGSSRAKAAQPTTFQVPKTSHHAQEIGDPVEETKVLGVHNNIRDYVRSHDGKASYSFPVEDTQLLLSVPEAEAFRVDFAGEKSFRGEYASAMTQSVTLQARMISEMNAYKAKRNSSHLWEPHAASLKYLVQAAQRVREGCVKLAEMAQQRGLSDKAGALKNSIEKLETHIQLAAKTLE